MKNSSLIRNLLFLLSFPFFINYQLEGQTSTVIKKYDVNVTGPGKRVVKDQLKQGGTNSSGESIGVNNFYFTKNGKPFIPITGEFHFSRYPNKYWDESIRKMKSGGINIIATYVFWNIHEENEGEFDWTGDKDLRKFIELCASNDIKVIVRLGPFCHGEIRNGGLPDWLFTKTFNVRSNDPGYLAYVERLYTEIGKQLNGLYFKDNGPVIGIQLENEYQHSASPWSLTYPGQPADWTSADIDKSVIRGGVSVADTFNPYSGLGNEHMKVLKALAERAGILVPVYTATGWGNAAVIEGETIPVTASYPYPTWVTKSSLSSFYLFTDLQKHPDYAPVRYNPEDYPYFPAEIGGGMTNNYSRRPTIPAESLDALINRFLGSGSNGVGYYMFHGGATPRGNKYFFSDEAYGYPKINYDYQAPIGQYGQINASFHRLKLLHYFLNAFGDRLAPMSVYLPENNASITAGDTTDLRFSVRSKESSGFVFMQNFQDYLRMNDKKNIQIIVQTGSGEISIPESSGLTLKSEENLLLPFNFDLGGVNLIYSNSQLLTKVGEEKNPCFVFFEANGNVPEFSISKTDAVKVTGRSGKIDSNNKRWLVKCDTNSEFTIVKKNGGKIKILVIDKSFALKSWIINIRGVKYLAFSDALILDDKDSFGFYSYGNKTFDFFIYPKLIITPVSSSGIMTDLSKESKIMSKWRVELPETRFDLKTEYFGNNKAQLSFSKSISAGVNDVFINIKYTGDTGMCFLNGDLGDDQFYYGQPWLIGLKKFYDVPVHDKMTLYFRPIYSNAPYLIDLNKQSIPDFANSSSFLKIDTIESIIEYKTSIKF
jgi:beta-galactosidase